MSVVSEPESKYLLRVDSFDEFNAITHSMSRSLCEDVTQHQILSKQHTHLGSDSFYQHVFLQNGGLWGIVSDGWAHFINVVYDQRLALRNPDLPLL